MRAFDIALFLALFTAVGGVVDNVAPSLNIYENPIDEVGYTNNDFSKINGEIITADDSLVGGDSKIATTSLMSAISQLGDYVLIKQVIINIFATNLIPGSEERLQIESIANLSQIGCAFIYMFAVVQLWRKVSIKHME